jgi:hypothetical protein
VVKVSSTVTLGSTRCCTEVRGNRVDAERRTW